MELTQRPVFFKETNPDKISFYLWGIFAICFLAHIVSGIISTMVPAYLPSMIDYFSKNQQVNEFEAGSFINSFYLVGWALGGMTLGYISDRLGRVKTFAICLAWLGVWTFLLTLSISWQAVAVFRFLAGLGTGGIMVVAMTFLSEIWPQKTRAVIIGIVSIGFPIGIFSSGIIIYLVDDWKTAMNFGVIPIVLSVLVIYWAMESPKWTEARISRHNSPKVKTWNLPNLWASTIIFGSMVIGLWSAFSWIPTWAQSLIEDSDGQKERGIIMMLLGFFGILGGACSGWAIKWLGVRKSMIFCFCGVALISILLYGGVKTFSIWIYILSALLSLIFGMSQGILSFFVPQLFPVPKRAFATGISFNTGRFITAIAVFSVGGLVGLFGSYGNSLLAFTFVFIPGLIATLNVKTSEQNY